MADGGAPKVYYNEIDAYCAQWLRNLMDAGHIPAGDIDTRSIEDVQPDELRGYTQCHFFAGIGGWPYALALAGWPPSRPVWTGSCPCQPFSQAGKGLGFADQRHLWPAWQHLISQRNPPVVFGEQVANATDWLGLVCGDLEGMGYAVGFNHIEAASAGADHRRDRIFFVADTGSVHAQGIKRSGAAAQIGQESGERSIRSLRLGGCALAHAHGKRPRVEPEAVQAREPESRGHSWIIGHDGKARRVEPDIRLLAHGVPARVGRLRAYGNAIVPQVAAEFIGAYIEARGLIAANESMTLLRDRA